MNYELILDLGSEIFDLNLDVRIEKCIFAVQNGIEKCMFFSTF